MVTFLLSGLLGYGRRESVANDAHASPHATGSIGYTALEDFPQLYLLASAAETDGAVLLCGATDEPIGPVNDRPSTGDRAAVSHLGATEGTRSMVASKAISSQTRVYTDAGGKVTDVAVSGSWLVGRSVNSSLGNGDVIEVVPCFPVAQA